MFDNYDAGIGEGRVTGIFVFDPPCEPPSLPVVSCRSARQCTAIHNTRL